MMLFGVWLLYFGFGLTASALAPLVRPITADLQMSYAAMGTVLGAWQFVYLGSALPCGALVDRIGLRRSLLFASGLIGLSCLLRGMASGHLTLLLAVGVFGLGGPLVSVGAPKLIRLWFDGPQRGLAMGLYVTGPALGGIAALSLTNAVMMPWLEGEWRQVLLVYGVVVLSFGLLWLVISSHSANRELEQQQSHVERPPQLEIFARLVRIPAVQWVLLLSIGIFLYNHGLSNWLHEILQTRGLTADHAGFWASIPTVAGIVAVLVFPRLATPERRIPILAGLFACAGVAVLLLCSETPELLLAGLVLKGLTQGSMMTILLLVLVEIPDISERDTGAAGGMFFTAAEIGGVLGPVSLGLISDSTGGFTPALLLLSGVCFGMVLMLRMLKRHTTLRQ